jgi:hypothetical protein
MSLFHGEQIIDDSNWKTKVGNGKEIFVGGEMRYLSAKPRTEPYGSYGYAVPFSSRIPRIPRSEWPDRIKEQERLQQRVSDYQDFETYNQNGTNYCWANGPCQAFTTVRRIMGLPLVVISSASVAGPIKGYSNSGGWEADAVEYLTEHGGVSVELWPNNARDRKLDNEATREDRKNHICTEALDMDGFDDYATACLLTIPCGFAYNWMSHVMMTCDLVQIENGSYGLRIRNSHGHEGAKNKFGQDGYTVYREGRGTPDSGMAIRQVLAATK